MRYILYEFFLNEGKYSESIIDSTKSAIIMFRLSDPDPDFFYTEEEEEDDFEYSKSTLELGQGWMASDTEDKYTIVFRDEPGMFEHFMKWCKHPEKVSKIMNRSKNLEKLLDE